jgi:shikimate dehydrogenase
MTGAARKIGRSDLFAPIAAPAVQVGLIGAGIQASRTPRMHEAEAAAQGLRCVYRLIDLDALGLGIEALPDLVAMAQRAGFAGLNITHPCKQAVIPLLDGLSDDAKAIGAVNTVVFKDGKRIGHNTDWWGFAESFRRGLPDARMRRVVQLGAGGAGAAVAHAMLTLGVKMLAVVDVDRARADALAKALADRFGGDRVMAATDLADALETADGLINTTPVGMDKYPGLPLPATLLRPTLWVADIVYFPLETALLRAARMLGCRTLDGSGMTVFQAVAAFRLFTGLEPDDRRMARTFAAATPAGA